MWKTRGQGETARALRASAELLGAASDRLIAIDRHDGGDAREVGPLPARARRFREWSARLGKRSQRVRDCGTEVRGLACEGCGLYRELPGAVPDLCRVRLCPRCDRNRADKLRAAVPAILARKTHPLKFVTLTVANVRSLETPEGNALRLLSRCTAALRRELKARKVCARCHRWKRRKRAPLALEFCPGEGCSPCPAPKCAKARRNLSGDWRSHELVASLRAIEVTYSDEGGWHPHVHMLADMPWTCQRALSALWAAITERDWPGGRSPIVDVRMPYGQDRKQLAELLKYPTKVADLTGRPEKLAEFAMHAHGVRFVQATGAWRAWQELLDELELDGEAGRDEGEEIANALQSPCECGCVEWRFVTVAT